MYSNIMEIKFPNKSDNERFARTVAAAFVLELNSCRLYLMSHL